MNITTDQARTALHEIVAEFGREHRYTPPFGGTCWYTTRTDQEKAKKVFDNDESEAAYRMMKGSDPVKPGCLIGQMLHRLGMSLTYLAKLDNVGGISSCIMQGLVTVDSQALHTALTEAQRTQDQSGTWGEALDRFDRTLVVRRGEVPA